MDKQHQDEKIMDYINYSPESRQDVGAVVKQEKYWTEAEVKKAIESSAEIIYQGKILHFSPCRVLEKQVILYLPDEFSLMPKAMAAQKYPGRQLPQVICSDPAGEVNATLNHTEHQLLEGSVSSFQQTMAASIKKMQPAAELLSEAVIDNKDVQIGCFEVLLPALDGKTYNLIYCLPLKQRALIGSINCSQELMPFWQSAAKVILAKLKIQHQ